MTRGDVMRVVEELVSAGLLSQLPGGETSWSLKNTVFLPRDTLVMVLEPETIGGWCTVALPDRPGRYAVRTVDLGDL